MIPGFPTICSNRYYFNAKIAWSVSIIVTLLTGVQHVSSLAFGPDHYMDFSHPRPGIDYYGQSISGPLQDGPTLGYFRPGETTGKFVSKFADTAKWSNVPDHINPAVDLPPKPLNVTAVSPSIQKSSLFTGTCWVKKPLNGWDDTVPHGVVSMKTACHPLWGKKIGGNL